MRWLRCMNLCPEGKFFIGKAIAMLLAKEVMTARSSYSSSDGIIASYLPA